MGQEDIRQNGVYYSDYETIMKVIKPLFLNDLSDEFELIKNDKKKLSLFHDKLTKLKFLDPANGVGNFLTVTYFKLSEIEMKIIKQLIKLKQPYNFKVNAGQFYGIDIDLEACKKCIKYMKQTDQQINDMYKSILKKDVKDKRLFVCPKIVNENALRIDWNEVVNKNDLNYIISNPPFVGARLMRKNQKSDMFYIWGKHKGIGNLDYVTAWYKKASDYMKNTKIESTFVSTNSITQGEQPAILWEPLVKENNAVINFAYRTFKWGNKAKGKKAQVHCVIIGFSDYQNYKKKKIYDLENQIEVSSINAYLVNAPNILIQSRIRPINKVPKMCFGNMPNDGGNLILNQEEKEKIIKDNPLAKKWIRKFVGAKEFLNGKSRWCLWLVDANPSELRKCKLVMSKINNVRQIRNNSKRKATKNLRPSLFGEIRQPDTEYILVPAVSSENRKYIPMGFMDKNTVVSNRNLIISRANLYEFGILESSIHMAWMRAVAGRLKSDYSYSSSIVYNNFIWPKPTDNQKEKIEKTAQDILDVRKLYPNSTLADLYDPNTMPPKLVKAHEKNDKAVKEAYGKKGFDTEEEIVSSLMKMYKEAIDLEKINHKKII